MKKFFALCIVIFCLGACEQQPVRDNDFVVREREIWDSQNHISCDKLFGFAYGYWDYRRIMFDWVATSDPEGYISIKINRRFPGRILRRFIGMGVEFQITVNSGNTTIKILNNDWIATHAQPKVALDTELNLILEKTNLVLKKILHHTFRWPKIPDNLK